MRAVSTFTATFAIGAALWSATSPAAAVGFGRVTNTTQLGQPLNFAAAVRLEPEELLPRECVSAEVQSGDNRLQPQQVRVTLEGGVASADRNVRITTSTPIDEPVVTVSVTLGCSSKVTRRFVAFIDPPLINTAQTVPLDTLPPQRVDSQVAPIVAIVQGANASASGARRADRTAAPRARPRSASQAVAADASGVAREAVPARAERPKRSSPVTRQPLVARAAPAGSRLQLEATAPVVASSASAPASAAIAAPPLTVVEPAAASRSDASVEQLAKERQRIQSLEEGVAKLRRDAQATQASVTALQARLQAAESERYANPLVYALAWISALLALAVAGLWWRQSRAGQASQWWAGPAPAPAASNAPLAAAAVNDPVVSAPQPLGAPHTLADAFAISTMVDDDPPAALAPTRLASFVATPPAPIVAPDEPARELSVEELIDLEQQVEFFIVLGQDEAAIELLMSHVRSDGGISPLPYLKLLEIYRRRGEDAAYQRIRDRFNRRFNAYAPDWDSDLQQGRTLIDYPDTIVRLQQLWASPVRVMETLDASLFRRNKTDETFDLPAYRELLFLYAIARDLAEHAGALPNTTVDLLLPLDDPGEEPIARLTATTQAGDFQRSDMMTIPLDLDVSFGPGATQEVETTPSALRRSGAFSQLGDSNFIDFDLNEPAVQVKPGGGR